VRVGLKGPDALPQLAQWGVLEHHLFGGGLPLDSELLRGTLAMLKATEIEGLPVSVGWLRDGLWTGIGALYAHLPLLLGEHERAADLLYAMANHATPVGGWVEEQSLKSAPSKLAGDQPHCWAPTIFTRLVLSMLACEHNDTVHLLLATPPEWLRPGMVNKLDRVQIPGGSLSLSLIVSADGRDATLEVLPPRTGPIVLHTRSLQAAGFKLADRPATPDELPVSAGEKLTVQFAKR
jgi:hypothetical protein